MATIGDLVYFKNGPNGYVQKDYIVGETSRSWYVSGIPNPWWASDPKQMAKHGRRYEKKELLFVSEEEFILELWAQNNRNEIRNKIWSATPQQLKEIGEILGMEVEKNNGKS